MTNNTLADLEGHANCPRCGPAVRLDWKRTQCILEHMSAHILHDGTLNSSDEVCRLCPHPSPMCQIYLSKGCKITRRVLIDWAKSTCPNLIHSNYKSMAQSLDQSPCSIVPVNCSLCSAGSQAIWMYSLHAHYHTHHELSSAAHFPTCMELSQV